MESKLNNLHIGILGGGITGLTSAFYLLRAGLKVTLIEARPQLGGLASWFDFGPFFWDKFYHCILTSDRALLTLIDDLNLSDQLRWTDTKVGFYSENSLHSMTTTLDFLRFPPLNLWEKFRLGLGVLWAARIKEGRALESIPVAEWLIRVFGKANYQKMWGPLLKCKLGSCREEASAAFIWATISRLYSTREGDASKKERMGYVRGGYRTLFARLIQEIERLGGNILTGVAVRQIESRSDGGIDLLVSDQRLFFDRVIATVPNKAVIALAPELSSEYLAKLSAIKYLGIVCVVLVLKRRLSPFYCTNLTDEDLPFTGIIEMTNLIRLEETNGYHLVYLPKYTAPGDPLFDTKDEDVWALFYSHLRRIFPDLKDDEIERRFIFRERLVQPLPVLNYSDLVPSVKTNIPGVMVANTTQIVNSTLNNNEMVKIAGQAVARVLTDPGGSIFDREATPAAAVHGQS